MKVIWLKWQIKEEKFGSKVREIQSYKVVRKTYWCQGLYRLIMDIQGGYYSQELNIWW